MILYHPFLKQLQPKLPDNSLRNDCCGRSHEQSRMHKRYNI